MVKGDNFETSKTYCGLLLVCDVILCFLPVLYSLKCVVCTCICVCLGWGGGTSSGGGTKDPEIDLICVVADLNQSNALAARHAVLSLLLVMQFGLLLFWLFLISYFFSKRNESLVMRKVCADNPIMIVGLFLNGFSFKVT